MKTNFKNLLLISLTLAVFGSIKCFATDEEAATTKAPQTQHTTIGATPGEYTFSEDYQRLYEEYLKDPKKFKSDISLDKEEFYKTYTNDQLSINTNLVVYYATTNTNGIASAIHQMRYETLVYAYVFAKAQHKEKAFFMNAFPREGHCVPSQVTPVQSWLMAEKESLFHAPEEIAKSKLIINIRDVFRTNAFMGARIHNIILYWFAPKCIEYYKTSFPHMTPMSLEEYEANPQNLETYFLDFENGEKERVAELFSTEVLAIIRQEAIKEAVNLWNRELKPHEQYHLSKGNISALYTEDSNIQVKFRTTPKKVIIDEFDVTIESVSKLVPVENSISLIYKDMKTYLREQFLGFFAQAK